jgi:hypothetical protein
VMGFFRIGSMNYFLGLVFSHDPPDLCLLNSMVYRCKPPAPGRFFYLTPKARMKLHQLKKLLHSKGNSKNTTY